MPGLYSRANGISINDPSYPGAAEHMSKHPAILLAREYCIRQQQHAYSIETT